MEAIQEKAREVAAESEPEPVTEAEIRRLRGLYMTVRTPSVIACGHRLNPNQPPRMRNCLHCWMAFFDTHPELLNTVDKLVQEFGLSTLAQFHGRKFVKYYGLYNEFVRAKKEDGKITS